MRRTCRFGIRTGIFVLAITLLVANNAWATTFKTLLTFSGSDGSAPGLTLTFDAAGNLYGATCGGGSYSAGVVFELTPSGDGTWTDTTLYEFTGNSDGSCPVGGVIFDASGNLYSATSTGGTYGFGTVFELTPNLDGPWTETVLHTFTGGADGRGAGIANLVFDAQGALYGTTSNGGLTQIDPDGAGLVYKLTPNSDGTWSETVLYDFTGGADGWHPVTSLVFDASGNLYGSTQWGGRCSYCGIVFELSPNADGTWTEHVLHAFSGGKDGEQGCLGMVFDTAGNLYGATMGGGLYSGNGVAFRLIPKDGGGWTEQELHQFSGKDGGGSAFAAAACNPTLDAAGNLWGTRYDGGAYGYGVVYRLSPTPSGGVKDRYFSFNDRAGYANSGVIFDAAGNAYGVTQGDGSISFGTVYEITP